MKAGHVQDALKHYYEAYLQLRAACPSIKDPMAASLASQRTQSQTPAEKIELQTLKRAVYGNMCVVYAKQSKWDRVVKMAEEILQTGEGISDAEVVCKANVKLMYRLAAARMHMGDTERARHWTERVLQIEPQNIEVD